MEPAPRDDDLDELARFAAALADAAAEVTTSLFRAEAGVQDKGGAAGFDPVTEADRGAERAMRALIEARHPDHGIDGEEYGVKPAAGPWSWTLDPIDGTRGFICGVPMWTTLIACSFEGRPLIGVIDQPVLGERYLGRPGRAVFRRGARQEVLRSRACPQLTDAVVSCTDPPAMFAPAEAAAFEQVRRTARLARYGLDAYAYAQLAAGRIDLVIESGLQTYDTAALAPVVEGAGGVVTDWRGNARPDSGQVVAAGDPACLEAALVALGRAAA
ncbi:MAG: histidinol-phosphatase [Caulobacterales bacterium]|nr:histidinol-phosphatase [Caulobacterales bacterium]